MAVIDDFHKLEIRVGEILRAEVFEKAKKPAYKLWIDFGADIGVLQSSAQITQQYRPKDLLGKQVLAVVNFPPRQIADFISQVLVLGACTQEGVVLIAPEKPVPKGVSVL